jgi:hypothetical protein
MSEQGQRPTEEEQSDRDAAVEDLEVPQQQSQDIAGGSVSSGDVLPTENISLRK